MTASNPWIAQLAPREEAELEGAAARFELAWRQGPPPLLDDYLPQEPVPRLAVLIELIHADLEIRLFAGESVQVESYLSRYPELGRDRAAAAAFLVAEYAIRHPREPDLGLEDYLHRFPDLQAELAPHIPAKIGLSATTVRSATESVKLNGADERHPPRLGLHPFPDAPAVPGYEIQAKLGQGGMGVVYQARQLRLGRLVALKMILGGGLAGEDSFRRFQREAEAVARLQHPNIVQIHEVGEYQGRPFLSLEFCPGGSLDRKLAGAPLPAREAAQLTEILARAAHAAHQAHVIHRDLKPANVLLTADGTPKITDFGLAKRLDEAGQTQTGEVMGTPSYMAPEQAAGKNREVGATADVYALGAVLYECLTGRPPFKAATVMETLMQVLTEEPAPPRRLQSGTPRDLETICLKCLEKQPSRRYASAAALADDLQRFLQHHPIQARPARWPEHVGKWMKRRPFLAGMLGVTLAAMLALAGVAAWHTVTLGNALDQVSERERQVKLREQEVRDHLYVSDLKLAHQFFWRTGDVARMAERLHRHTPGPGEVDRRGFAWHYLEQLSRGPGEATLPGHANGTLAVAFSPDGLTLATAGRDGEVRLWDTASWRLRRALAGQDGTVWAIAFSPDGRWLASADSRQIVLWDPRDGRRREFAEHRANEVRGLTFAPDGKRLASWSGATVYLRDVATGKLGHSVSPPLPIACFAFGRDGMGCVVGRTIANVEVRIWDPDKGSLREIFHAGSSTSLSSLALHPHGERLALVRSEYSVALRPFDKNARTFDWGFPLTGLSGNPRAVAFSPDGAVLATGDASGVVRLWNGEDGADRGRFKGHTGAIDVLAFAPDGRRLASASADGAVRVWQVGAVQDHDALRPPLAAVGPVAYAADGKYLVAAYRDATARVFDARTGQEHAVLRGHRGSVLGLAAAARAPLAATSGSDQFVRVWDLSTGRMRAELSLPDLPPGPIAQSPDGARVVAARGTDLVLWDWQTGQKRFLPHSHTRPIRSLAFAPDGKSLVTADGGSPKLWNLATGAVRDCRRFEGEVMSAAFSPDGRVLVGVGRADGPLHETFVVGLWTVADPDRPPKRIKVGGDFTHSRFAFTTDGKRLAIAELDAVVLIDASTGRLSCKLRCFRNLIVDLAFAPDGSRLAASSLDGVLQLWDLVNHRVIVPPAHPMGQVTGLAFSPNSALLYTGSQVRQTVMREVAFAGINYERHVEGCNAAAIRIWDVSSGAVRATLPAPPLVQLERLALSPDGRELAVGCTGGVVGRWSLPGRKELPLRFTSPAERSYWEAVDMGRRLAPIDPKFKSKVNILAFSPDGTTLVAVNDKGSIGVWDARSGEPGKLLLQPSGRLSALAFSPDNQLLAVCCDQQIELWDVASGARRHAWAGAHADIYHLAFSPDGSFLAGGGGDRRIHLWDVATGSEKAALSGHTGPIVALAFCCDGQTLASAAADRTVRLWHLPTLQELFSLQPPADSVVSLAFSPDGQTLAAGGDDNAHVGEVYLWRTGRGPK